MTSLAPADALLLWLSARGEGSWGQFRGAVERAMAATSGDEPGGERDDDVSSDLPIYQRVRLALQALAHVEFFVEGADWRVVPGCVSLVDDSCAVLCGARDTRLVEMLAAAAGVTVKTQANNGGPSCITLAGNLNSLSRAAAELGLGIQRNAPSTLLSALPTLRESATARARAIPETPGWRVQRFSENPDDWGANSWQDLPRSDVQRDGLLRYSRGYERQHYLRRRGKTYEVNVQVGKYAVVRRRSGALRYNTRAQTLSVPLIMRPPPLVERALVLCSGLLPAAENGTLAYAAVSEPTARLAAELLSQDLS